MAPLGYDFRFCQDIRVWKPEVAVLLFWFAQSKYLIQVSV